MFKVLLLILLFPILSVSSFKAQAVELEPFETDYCTMFIDGNWQHCCLEHDLRYWIGGDKADQFASDLKLKACVKEEAGVLWANTIYHAVRLGHYSPIKNKYKWSWGWSEREEFSKLSALEKQTVIKEIHRSTLDPKVVRRFIWENNLEAAQN